MPHRQLFTDTQTDERRGIERGHTHNHALSLKCMHVRIRSHMNIAHNSSFIFIGGISGIVDFLWNIFERNWSLIIIKIVFFVYSYGGLCLVWERSLPAPLDIRCIAAVNIDNICVTVKSRSSLFLAEPWCVNCRDFWRRPLSADCEACHSVNLFSSVTGLIVSFWCWGHSVYQFHLSYCSKQK